MGPCHSECVYTWMASDSLDHFHCTDEQAPTMLTSAFAADSYVVKLSVALKRTPRWLFSATTCTREITFISFSLAVRARSSRVGKRKERGVSRELLVIALRYVQHLVADTKIGSDKTTKVCRRGNYIGATWSSLYYLRSSSLRLPMFLQIWIEISVQGTRDL